MRTTLVLIVLAVALGGWVLWDLNNVPEETRTGGSLLMDFPREATTRIEIDRPDPGNPAKRELLVFERREGGWFVAMPDLGKADPKQITEMIQQACANWSGTWMKVPEDPGKYGLGESALRVTMVHPGGKAVVRIGAHNDLQKGVYAHVEGDPYIGLMDQYFDKVFHLPVSGFLLAPADEQTKSPLKQEEVEKSGPAPADEPAKTPAKTP